MPRRLRLYSANFVCVSWNVRGIPMSDLGDFLNRVSHDYPWSILFLQEFIQSKYWKPTEAINGHGLIVSLPPVGNARRLGVVVHRDCAFTLPDRHQSLQRACGAVVHHPHWGKVIIGAGHLHPSRNRDEYRESINELCQLVDGHGDAKILLGIDANCDLHGADSNLDQLVGRLLGNPMQMLNGTGHNGRLTIYWNLCQRTVYGRKILFMKMKLGT